MELIRSKNAEPFGQFINAAQEFWLPPETPFGNLSLKLFGVYERLGHANKRIEESAVNWHSLMRMTPPGLGNPGSDHRFATEESVFMVRRAADELVALVWVLSQRLSTGSYPTRVLVDSVGGAIHFDHALFHRHVELLTTLNEVANAHKHSFLNSDLTIVGPDEPCVVALGLKMNNLENEPALYVVALNQLVLSFNAFLIDCFGQLHLMSDQLRTWA